MYTYLGIVCENTLHVGSHVWVMKLVSSIRFNRITEEVVGDLVRKTERDGIVIDFILYEMHCISVIREHYFAHKWPHRVGDRKLYLFSILCDHFFASLSFFSSFPG